MSDTPLRSTLAPRESLRRPLESQPSGGWRHRSDVQRREQAKMVIATFEGVTKHYGQEPVLAGATGTVRRGAKIAIVGPNGAGKSTLIKILANDEEADRGAIEIADSVRVGYLRQHPDLRPDATVWEEAKQGLGELYEMVAQAESLAAELAETTDETERRRLGQVYDRLHERLLAENAYHLDHRIERVLHGLGITESTWQQRCGELSGGQQRRLMLAKTLIAPADLLLLDEPTNHLDLEACQWLEAHLAQSPQALILISHDRYMLDAVATETWELFAGTIEPYKGNFSAYLKQKRERLLVQERTYERQQQEIAKLEEFVRRHHYGQKHAQAEDRRKKLERMERVAPPRTIAAPPMRFPESPHSGEIVLRVERLGHAYGGPQLFADLTFDVLRGEKWGILGANGTGKTTLLRCLAGQIQPRAGQVVVGAGVQMAYFDQQLAHLKPDDLVVDAVRPDGRDFPERERRDLLARFGVTGDMVFQRIRELSGGERTRVALARLSAAEANLLVLDEPTNQLDLWARQSLEQALREFDGTVVCVSHDRFFVNQVADQLLVFEPQRVRRVHGNYDTYRMLLDAESDSAPVRGAPDDSAARTKNSNTRRDGQRARKRQFPYRKVEDIESEIATLESEMEEWHAKMAQPDFHRDGADVKHAKERLEQINERLEQLYLHWEEACELNG